MRKIAIVFAGSRPDSMQPLITPRATMSTRVFETTFIITAIFSTPGLREHELGERAGLLHAGVAADLAVVGRAAAVLAHGVEERERAAAGADDQAQVAVELGDVAGDAAVVRGIDARARDLERGRRPREARLVGADAELVEQFLVQLARLALEIDVAVEHEEAPVLEPHQRVDLGERQVVAQEDLDQRRHDRGRARERRAA